MTWAPVLSGVSGAPGPPGQTVRGPVQGSRTVPRAGGGRWPGRRQEAVHLVRERPARRGSVSHKLVKVNNNYRCGNTSVSQFVTCQHLLKSV